jgi:hypothetical protein
MKYAIPAVLFAALTAFLVFRAASDAADGRRLADDAEFRVALAYNPSLLKDHSGILEAYKSVLEEEGVPYQLLDTNDFYKIDPTRYARHKPVIIFADGINQVIPMDIRTWVYPYIQNGGNVAAIYDAGVKDRHGNYRPRGQFAELLGLDYSTYDRLRDRAYTTGNVQFHDNDALDYFEIPPGCTDAERYLTSYMYGRLEFPIARTAWIDEAAAANLRADVVASSEDEHFPAVVIHRYGASRVLYVNLPLGYIKGQSYDMPLRSVLRSFLFRELRLPHLSNTPFGKPIFIFNWHIDSGVERDAIPQMIAKRFFRPQLACSFDICAGDWLEDPGDAAGFDACGGGRETAASLERFGTVGSHGGWAHNWFADGVDTGTLTSDELFAAIEKNSACLAEVVGHPILEYAAPGGAFPQPASGRYLEEKGYVAYYNTGDAGCAPNRTFWEGRMVSPHAIAFPIMPMWQAASFVEIATQYEYDPEDFRQWLTGVLDYTVRHGVARMLYSHPYDVIYYFSDLYRNAFESFLDRLEEAQAQERVAIKTMTDYATFYLRFLETKAKYKLDGRTLAVELHNDQSLLGVTLSLPKERYTVTAERDLIVTETPNDYLVAIADDARDRTIRATLR